jgi:hypothetical protein
MNKIVYAALFVALTASTAGFAQTTVQCDSTDQFCNDTNSMLQSMDSTVAELGKMASSSSDVGADLTLAQNLNSDLQQIMALPQNNCPTSCTPSTCDPFCTAMVNYSSTLNGDIGALQNDQTTISNELGPNGAATTATTKLQTQLQGEFQAILTDIQTVETDLGAICTAYGNSYGSLSNVCGTSAGKAAMAAYQKFGSAKQKAMVAAAQQSLAAKDNSFI